MNYELKPLRVLAKQHIKVVANVNADEMVQKRWKQDFNSFSG